MNFLLSKKIEEFDLEEFLQDEGIEYSTSGKNIGKDYVGLETCPFCEASNFHFGIQKSYKGFNCWVCSQSGSLINLIAQIKNISYEESKKFIMGNDSEDEDAETTIRKIFQKDEEKPEIKENKKEIVLPDNIPITSKMVKNNYYIKDFFEKKGLNTNHCKEYNIKLGISGLSQNKLIFPITYKKKLVAYQTRSIIGKFYNITGNAKHYLYQWNKIPKYSNIIIVEGILDYITTQDFLFKFYKNKYFSTTPFSKIITEEQIRLLKKKKPKSIISFLDRDAWFNYNNFLYEFDCNINFIIPSKKDPNNMNEKDFLKLFKDNKL